MATVYQPGIYEPGIYDADEIFAPLAFADVTTGGASVFGLRSETIFALAAERRYPQVLFVTSTWTGTRYFSDQRLVVPAGVTVEHVGAFSTLRRVSDLDLSGMAVSGDLIASLSALRQPLMRVEIDNLNRYWSAMLDYEPVLGQPAGLFLYYGGTQAVLAFRGKMERIELRKRHVTIEFGES